MDARAAKRIANDVHVGRPPVHRDRGERLNYLRADTPARERVPAHADVRFGSTQPGCAVVSIVALRRPRRRADRPFH